MEEKINEQEEGGAGWKQKEADGGAGWGMRENQNNQEEEKWGVGRGIKLKEVRGERAEKGGRKSRRKGGFKLWQKERWENELQEKLEAIMDIFFFCEQIVKNIQRVSKKDSSAASTSPSCYS